MAKEAPQRAPPVNRLARSPSRIVARIRRAHAMSQDSPHSPPSPPWLPETPSAGHMDSSSAPWWRRGTVGLLIAIVLFPLIARQLPREIARWQAAIALEHRLAGENQAADEALDRAIARDPSNATFFLQRALWRSEDERLDEALEACDRAVELAPWNHLAIMERSRLRQQLGRWKEAVDDWKEVEKLNESRRLVPEVQVWNGLAYARGLAGVELELALEDIQRAIKRQPDAHDLLDTRGYVLYRLDRLEEALQDLDRAVALAAARRKIADETAQAKAGSAQAGQAQAGTAEKRIADERRLRARELAVLLYHRSLVLDKMQTPKTEAAAAADRDRVRQLGFRPNSELF